MQRLPLELTQAFLKANAYRIRPSHRGFNVWRFRDWSNKHPGWSVIAANLKDRDAAQQAILERLELEPEQPKPTVIVAQITYVEGLGPWI